MQADNSTNNVIISGGTQGLGLAIAKVMARQGCPHIVISGRAPEKGAAAAQEVTALGTDCHYITCDVAIESDCRNLVAAALDRFGSVNALVNCAATTTRGSILDTGITRWHEHLAINLTGPFLLMQGVAQHLDDTGKPGSLVNILSTSAHVGQSFLAPYSASKGGLMTLTKNAANALLAKRIRVNAVAPGWMDTPAEDMIQKTFHDAPDNWLEAAEASMPMGQLAKPDQLAPLIAWLLSPNSGVITGAVIDYDQQVVGALQENG
jgi:NAD(P)-dependent dehydrogenase (short-subunit alcohol dehydrogenase family)